MASGQNITYSATVPQMRVVTDRIIMTQPMELVAVNALGLNNESSFNFANGPAGPNQPYEWLEDTHALRVSTINTDALTSLSTLTSVTVATGSIFQVGDVILVDIEYMLVTGIATNALTVTRNYGGTDATHSTGTNVTIVGRNRIEGTATDNSQFTEPTSATNAVAILHKEIDISRSAANLQRYGIGNLVEWEINKAMVELPKLLNLMFYHGQRKGGSASTPSGFGGFEVFATTNTNALSSTPALTQKNVEDELQDCFDAGGAPDLIICNSWAKRKIADFYSGYVRTERSETLGGITIESIISPVLSGPLMIALDRDCPTDSLYIIDRRFAGYVTIDPFMWDPLGKVGDTAAFGQVVGEYSFVLANETWHSSVTGFSTSA
jgi:hypothetical protein